MHPEFRLIPVAFFAAVLSGCGPADPSLDPSGTVPDVEPGSFANAEGVEQTEELLSTGTQFDPAREAWGRERRAHRPTRKGCFRAVYPDGDWEEVKCKDRTKHRPPVHPPPRFVDGRPVMAGNGADAFVLASGPTITAANGSFPSVTGVNSETDTTYGTDRFTLQLNTNLFPMNNYCVGCWGWQQFVYSNDGSSTVGAVFIEYWLFGPTPATVPPVGCPIPTIFAPWENVGYGCTMFGEIGDGWGNYSILSLSAMKLGAAANSDSVVYMDTPDGTALVSEQNYLGLAQLDHPWSAAEFNVVGFGNGSLAKFNPGSTITAVLGIDDGTWAAPTIKVHDDAGYLGSTGETNNLTISPYSYCSFPGKAANVSPQRAAVRFVESTDPTVPSPFCLLNTVTSIQASLRL